MTSTFKVTLKLMILIHLLLMVHRTASRPGGEWLNPNGCDDDIRLIEICQRCAKQTKSNLVYPMCCNKEDEVHNWCVRYTNFGKGKEV